MTDISLIMKPIVEETDAILLAPWLENGDRFDRSVAPSRYMCQR